jgi:hypothetical protein
VSAPATVTVIDRRGDGKRQAEALRTALAEFHARLLVLNHALRGVAHMETSGEAAITAADLDAVYLHVGLPLEQDFKEYVESLVDVAAVICTDDGAAS